MKIKFNLRETLRKYRRVLILAKKPTKEELLKTSKICGIGFLVMGFMGFVFYITSVIFGA